MPDLDIAEDILTIVLRGRFNPAIVSPAWLLVQGLIGEEDAEAATAELMVPQVSAFQLPWSKVEVTEDRFVVRTSDVTEFERCRDLTIGTFANLQHTPVNALGINRAFHVRMPSIEAWHDLGDRLVPKEPWIGEMRLPGVASLQIQGVREDDFGGQVVCRFEPSNRHATAVFLEYNDHYNLDTGVSQPQSRDEFRPEMIAGGPPSSERLLVALAILSKKWDESLSRADHVMRSVIKGEITRV